MKKWIGPILLLILFELIADIFAKEYSLKNTWVFWTLSLGSYIVANMFWLKGIKDGSGLAEGTIIFAVGSTVVAVILGVVFFKEPLTRTQMFGAFLGIISLIFILWE